MLIRWSIWKDAVTKDLEMLIDSVRSFTSVLGARARYQIYTDQVNVIKNALPEIDVASYFESPNPMFDVFSGSTWAKWCPSPRIAPGELEVLVDADVFLLDEPTELLSLLGNTTDHDFAILGEISGAPWQRGCFSDQISIETPFVNAGLVAQGPRGNISQSLNKNFKWWQNNVSPGTATHHDEQGAITLALESSISLGKTLILPTSRYTIVSPRSNMGMISLNDLILLHSTYPDHPAYHQYKKFIKNISCRI